jgi:hypothetical protein
MKGVCKNADFISKIFGSKISHFNPHSMANYFARYGLYTAEKDKLQEERFKLHNQKYHQDLKDIQDYQKLFAEKTWKLEKVIIKANKNEIF